MKKLIALLLVMVMAMGLIACGNNANTADTTEGAKGPASALELLETVWAAHAEDEKFFTMGGDMNNMVDGAPGKYDLADEGLSSTLLIPEDQIANVDEVASLVHAMMLNNFTCGAFHVTGDVAAFVEAMHTAIANNRWMCGMPEKMIIAVVETDYVIACFGINDAVAPFETAMNSVYGYEADIKYNEAITG